MENISAPVSPNVVDTILMTQYKKIMCGTRFFIVVFIVESFFVALQHPDATFHSRSVPDAYWLLGTHRVLRTPYALMGFRTLPITL